MKNYSICPTCGHKSVDYKHSINKTLISSLARLYQAGGTSRLDRLGLNNTQFTNFQKLRYFNLVVQPNNSNEWQITKLGVWFLQGRIQVAQYVITRNANVVRTSPELVFINQVKDCVEFKQDWKDQAKQPSLFD